jgi:hypothetical protein
MSDLKAICPINTLKEKPVAVTSESSTNERKASLPLTPPNSSIFPTQQYLTEKQEAESPSWLAGRNYNLYPTDESLPWHFSFIDDGMLGGSSAPSARFHYPAMAAQNIGLIVNLTESPLRPEQRNSEDPMCQSCENVPEIYDDDLFHDIHPTDDLQVLFLPVADGNIPRFVSIASLIPGTTRVIPR